MSLPKRVALAPVPVSREAWLVIRIMASTAELPSRDPHWNVCKTCGSFRRRSAMHFSPSLTIVFRSTVGLHNLTRERSFPGLVTMTMLWAG